MLLMPPWMMNHCQVTTQPVTVDVCLGGENDESETTEWCTGKDQKDLSCDPSMFQQAFFEDWHTAQFEALLGAWPCHVGGSQHG